MENENNNTFTEKIECLEKEIQELKLNDKKLLKAAKNIDLNDANMMDMITKYVTLEQLRIKGIYKEERKSEEQQMEFKVKTKFSRPKDITQMIEEIKEIEKEYNCNCTLLEIEQY